MTPTDFVRLVKDSAIDGVCESVLDTLIKPPGRRPQQRLVEMSEWYGGLSATDRQILRSIIHYAAHLAIFDLFVILDGNNVGADSMGVFELSVVSGRERFCITGDDKELHELISEISNPYE